MILPYFKGLGPTTAPIKATHRRAQKATITTVGSGRVVKPSPQKLSATKKTKFCYTISSDHTKNSANYQRQQCLLALGRDGSIVTPNLGALAPPVFTLSQRRRAQNRAAQRAFRERKEKHAKDLETQLATLTDKYTKLETSHTELSVAYEKLRKTIELLTQDGHAGDVDENGKTIERRSSNLDTLRKLFEILHGEFKGEDCHFASERDDYTRQQHELTALCTDNRLLVHKLRSMPENRKSTYERLSEARLFVSRFEATGNYDPIQLSYKVGDIRERNFALRECIRLINMATQGDARSQFDTRVEPDFQQLGSQKNAIDVTTQSQRVGFFAEINEKARQNSEVHLMFSAAETAIKSRHLQDYELELKKLDQQNKKRPLMAARELDKKYNKKSSIRSKQGKDASFLKPGPNHRHFMDTAAETAISRKGRKFVLESWR